MEDEDGLFNDYARRHRPLSRQLRPYTDGLRNQLNTMQADRVSDLTRDDIKQIIDGLRCNPITLGDPVARPAGRYRPRTYYAAMLLLEGGEYASCWPDQVEDVEPIDAHDAAAAVQWSRGGTGDGPTRSGIITVIELSEDEHR